MAAMGAVTDYTCGTRAVPYTQARTTQGPDGGTPHWTRTTMDGLGRTVKSGAGDAGASTRKSAAGPAREGHTGMHEVTAEARRHVADFNEGLGIGHVREPEC